jgi:AMP nucleosidase
MPGEEVKQRLRTGTVVTTDDRNWELRYSASGLTGELDLTVQRFVRDAEQRAVGDAKAIALGGDGRANRFYEGAISEHLQIGIRAIDLLRAEGDHMHSRMRGTPAFSSLFPRHRLAERRFVEGA